MHLVKYTFKYALVNKSSGTICTPRSLLPLREKLKALSVSSYLAIVHRLDKYVTGGLIVSRDETFTRRANKALRGEGSYKITRRYVGLVPVEKPIQELGKGIVYDGDIGTISYDVCSLEKEYGEKKEERKIVSQSAVTRFKILHKHRYVAPPQLARKYPGLFKGKLIYPVIFELQTGRKNQIRDHVVQAFGVPLLNDDNFSAFKWVSQKPASVNSVHFKNNQVGLHSAYVEISSAGQVKERMFFSVHGEEDRELWGGMCVDGEFSEGVKEELREFGKLT